MFSKYTDLKSTRGLMEAVSFYLVYTIFLVGLSTFLVHILGLLGVVGTVGTVFAGGMVHMVIGLIFILLLGSLVISEKGLSKDFLSIVLILIGLGLGYELSIFLGMVPVAILTMVKKG